MAGSRGRLFLFGPVLASSWGQLQPNFGPTWANFGQLGRNFVQLGCKINQLSTKMASNCAILNKSGPLEKPKIIVFHLEFVCFRDVSLDAIFGQLGVNLDQFYPTWELLGPNLDQLGANLVQLGVDLGHFGPNFGQLKAKFDPTWANLGPPRANLGRPWRQKRGG